MRGQIGTPMVVEFKNKPKTDFSDCEFFEDQVFIYHVFKKEKEIGKTVAKTSAAAIRNVAYRIHKKNSELRYSDIKDECEAIIFYEDIKEIRQIGNKVKIYWNWSEV